MRDRRAVSRPVRGCRTRLPRPVRRVPVLPRARAGGRRACLVRYSCGDFTTLSRGEPDPKRTHSDRRTLSLQDREFSTPGDVMELRALRYFVAVAEELHFGRAAERLHIAQPAVSQQIARLERELGVRLLDRSPRNVALTATGSRVLDAARDVLVAAERLRVVSGTPAVTLRIGTAAGLSARVERGIDTLGANGTPFDVVLVDLPFSARLDALLRGELDVALVLGEFSAPRSRIGPNHCWRWCPGITTSPSAPPSPSPNWRMACCGCPPVNATAGCTTRSPPHWRRPGCVPSSDGPRSRLAPRSWKSERPRTVGLCSRRGRSTNSLPPVSARYRWTRPSRSPAVSSFRPTVPVTPLSAPLLPSAGTRLRRVRGRWTSCRRAGDPNALGETRDGTTSSRVAGRLRLRSESRTRGCRVGHQVGM